jgi:hypothetical protein
MWPILFVSSHYCSNLLWVGVHVFLHSVLHLTKVLIACYSCASDSEDTTPSPCFMPFCFNTPCQFTPLFNLFLFVFGLTLWLVYFHLLKPFFIWEYNFFFIPFWIMPTFSGTQLGYKTRSSSTFWLFFFTLSSVWRLLLFCP